MTSPPSSRGARLAVLPNNSIRRVFTAAASQVDSDKYHWRVCARAACALVIRDTSLLKKSKSYKGKEYSRTDKQLVRKIKSAWERWRQCKCLDGGQRLMRGSLF